jgi:hypothetical protein
MMITTLYATVVHTSACCLLQVLTPEGDRVPGSLVEAAASAAGLHLRSGCNCNPGRCMANLDIRPEEVGMLQCMSHRGVPVLTAIIRRCPANFKLDYGLKR